MRLDDAETVAYCLMNRYALEGWSFGFDNAKNRCGYCQHGRKRITLSRHFVQMNDESDVRDTILHEIAHALVGPGHGHGRVWQRQAMMIGAKPERCATDVVMPKGNVEGLCASGCPVRHTRHRMPPARMRDGWQCRRCKSLITWVRVK